jgi:hypothetical protein
MTPTASKCAIEKICSWSKAALFAIVGIAGEDDLDAPDLNAAGPAEAKKPPLNRRIGSNGGQNQFGRKADGDAQHHSDNANLKRQLSAVLRDQLVSELKALSSADAAAIWARRILPAKNSLNIVDARQVENAFRRGWHS